MKLKLNPSLTHQQISNWDYVNRLVRPFPPTPEAVAKAQFVDKTYVWAKK